jgi:hypothetical protein
MATPFDQNHIGVERHHDACVPLHTLRVAGLALLTGWIGSIVFRRD